MSGIFKSIKKAFKKVGKIVKKIAPVLVVAAAVYFGGSYLMSMAGGANAAQSASVAKSFTKSAGVWKSFMGGLSNGTAASSAAAYAEASYLAADQGLNLAAQVQAGTSAVQSLSVVHDVAIASSNGVEAAKVFQNATDAGVPWDQASKKATESVANNLNLGGGGGGVTGEAAFGLDENGFISASTDQAAGFHPDQNIGQATVPSGTISQNVVKEIKPGGPAPFSPPSQAVSIDDLDPSDPNFANQLAKLQYKTDAADATTRHTQVMEMLGKQHERNMAGLYMQGAGMLVSAYGASQDSFEEKMMKKRMSWEPTGEEVDVVDPTQLQFPDVARSKGLLT